MDSGVLKRKRENSILKVRLLKKEIAEQSNLYGHREIWVDGQPDQYDTLQTDIEQITDELRSRKSKPHINETNRELA